jgi:hypothetical protein
VLDVTILQRTVPGARQQEAATCFRHEDHNCPRYNFSNFRARKLCAGCGGQCTLMRTVAGGRMYGLLCNPCCFRTELTLFEGWAVSLDGDHLRCECDGTGWVLYRSETVEGKFEEAYSLCPNGHAPRYCMGSGSGRLCPRPATARCGPAYYCKEHIMGRRVGRDADDACEGRYGPLGCFGG